ncbi:MAG: hypothetical protein K2K94_07510 [Muribaculaceae bacterium]|nr:hypothetical protein [Muribaculaceae bacterium]
MDKRNFERESIPSGIKIVGVGGGGKNIVAKAKEMSEYNIQRLFAKMITI